MRFIAVIGANRGQTPGIQLHAEHALMRANGLMFGRFREAGLDACIGFDYTQIDGRLMMAAGQKKATRCVAMKCNRLLPREGDTCFTGQDQERVILAHIKPFNNKLNNYKFIINYFYSYYAYI
jgi:hypothetical protein